MLAHSKSSCKRAICVARTDASMTTSFAKGSPALRDGHQWSSRALSKKPTTLRSYSAGLASSPPVCVDPGTLQIAFGSPAAA
jgi:hypothetical protein